MATPVTLRRVQEIVGRVAELDALTSWLDGSGPPILLLEGEAGIGKTTLWRAGVEEARERGLRILAASSVQSETQLSFTTFRDLVGDVFDDVADGLPGPQRRALEVTLLREEPEGTAPDRGAIGVAFLSVLRALGERERTLVALDDVQWTDAASQAPLRYALRRLEPGQGLCVLLARRVDETSSVPLELDRLDAGGIDRLRIGPLSVGALGHIFHTELESTYARPTLRRIHEVSGGNPFFALELARALGPEGESLTVGAALPVPGTLHELVDERLLSLPAETMDALVVASVLSRPTLGLLGAALERDPLPLIEPAAKARVADVDGATVRFVHPLFAAAVYDLAPETRRREVHRRLAEVVTDEEEHARHLARSADEPSKHVADVVERGGRLAAARGASAGAAELLEEAHRLTPDELAIERSRRAMEAGWLQFIAGNTARAESLLELASETAPAGPLHARALVRRAWLDHHTGDRRSALALYRAALDEAVGNPALEAEINSLLAWCIFIMREDVVLAERHARTAVALCEQIQDPVLEADSLAVLAQIEFFQGGGLPSPTMERALQLRPDVVDQRVLRHPRQHWALLLLDADRLDEARSHMQFARELADAHGDESALPWPLMRLAQLELLAGDWVQADAYAQEGLEAAVETGQTPPRADLVCTRALVLAHLGRVDEARATAEEGIRLAESCGAGIGLRVAQWALGLVDLSVGSFAEAHARLRKLRDASEVARIVDPGENRYLADLGESSVALRELDEADRLADELERLGTSLQRPSALAIAWRIRGLAALERGDLESALAGLEQALDHHRGAPDPVRPRAHAARARRRAAASEAAANGARDARVRPVGLRGAGRRALGGESTRRARPDRRAGTVVGRPHTDRGACRRARRRGQVEQGGRLRARALGAHGRGGAHLDLPQAGPAIPHGAGAPGHPAGRPARVDARSNTRDFRVSDARGLCDLWGMKLAPIVALVAALALSAASASAEPAGVSAAKPFKYSFRIAKLDVTATLTYGQSKVVSRVRLDAPSNERLLSWLGPKPTLRARPRTIAVAALNLVGAADYSSPGPILLEHAPVPLLADASRESVTHARRHHLARAAHPRRPQQVPARGADGRQGRGHAGLVPEQVRQVRGRLVGRREGSRSAERPLPAELHLHRSSQGAVRGSGHRVDRLDGRDDGEASEVPRDQLRDRAGVLT